MKHIAAALPTMAFWFALGAIGVAMALSSEEPIPNFQCPENYSPNYYEGGTNRYFNCVKNED